MRWMVFGLWTVTLPALAQTSGLPEAPIPAALTPVIVPGDVAWNEVLNLLPGESIEVRERATGLRTECVLEAVSDAVLTCGFTQRYRPYRRVLYPHAAIDRVWVTRQVHGPSERALLIGLGVGALLGGIAAHGGGPQGVSLGILGGGGLGASFVAASDPLGLRVHRQRVLIYRAQ